MKIGYTIFLFLLLWLVLGINAIRYNQQKIMDMCTDGQVDLCVNPADLETVTITVDGYCPDNDVVIKPTFAFWYKNLSNEGCTDSSTWWNWDAGYWNAGWFENGEAQIPVNIGDMYRFQIYYNGNTIEHDAVIQVGSNIGCENIPFSSDMCNFFQ